MSNLPHSDHGDDAYRAVSLSPGLPEIPERLLLAHARGEVLFICGAGISRPAGLPDFRELVRDVYERLDASVYEILPKTPNRALDTTEPGWSKLRNNQKAEVKRFVAGEYDVVLGMLERRLDDQTHEKNKITSKVRSTVAELLRQASDKPAPIHRALMRLADRGGVTTIMTTNFDLLLEAAAKRLGSPVQTYALGSIPRPTTRKEFAGVLHIHGALDRNPARFSDLVLSDQDLGEYYLRRRIVPDLIYDAARLFHLVLAGYSANDPPMRYLLNAVAADGARFSDLKERFTFVGSGDPVELQDWKARGITPIHYDARNGDHSVLRDALERWAKLSAINGKTKTVDVEVRRIVRESRAATPKADRDLFDHLFRRGHANERIRLAGVASGAKAEPGWLDSIIETTPGKKFGPATAIHSWAGLSETDRHHAQVMTTFLKNRLAEPATIDWALKESNWSTKRIAIDELLNDYGSPELKEPYATAWRLIEESWSNRPIRDHPAMAFVTIRDRLGKGERSGALISAIVDLFAPRLEVKAIEERPRHPKIFEDLLSANLTSVNLGNLNDYGDLHIGTVSEIQFLKELADGLASSVQYGLNVINRIYKTDEGREVPWESPHRVYFVRPHGKGRDVEEAFGHEGGEPDLFNDGIAPSVKLLHEIVIRISELDQQAATPFFPGWQLSRSGVHRRLWAAIARDPQLVSADDVGDFLVTLSDYELWGLDEFPEITELRARRVKELRRDVQETIVQRLCKGPPHKLKTRRRYCAAREVKRVEVAGGIIAPKTRRWLLKRIKELPQLEDMRVDGGFFDAQAHPVPRLSADTPYDLLEGEARLRALNEELSHDGVHWIDNSAKAWLQRAGSAVLLLSDLESFTRAGEEFPRLWDCFLSLHSPSPPTPSLEPPPQPQDEANRILYLLRNLSETNLTEAIWGISHWLFSWSRYVIRSEHGLPVWLQAWPIAVERTNAVANDRDHILTNSSGDQQESLDIDTLNTPAGQFIEVFLAACQAVGKDARPFSDGSPARQMRDRIISASDHSGLVAHCRLAERLPFFQNADPDWTKQYLVDPLLADDFQSIALWRKAARRSGKPLLEIIGDKVIERATDHRLGREARESLVSCLVIEVLTAFRDERRPLVAEPRVSQMLRSADDETRLFAACAIRYFQEEGPPQEGEIRSVEKLFHVAVKPFFRSVWPQESDLTTRDTSRELSHIPAASGEAFAEAVDEMKRFLVPFDCWSTLEYGLYGEVGTGSEAVSKLQLAVNDERKAAALLTLLDLTIGEEQDAIVPYDLSNALDRVKTLAPGLADCPAFRRLSTAARRNEQA
ncbi:MAG: SIR2 family protein [Deltaproteobacteria bacterium]|nr:SIR2 family protein [Deltaproteobacteria bacterium]